MARSVNGSVTSYGSGRSSGKPRSGYKTVGARATVDESLFASPSSSAAAGAPRGAKTAPAPAGEIIEVLTKDTIRKLRAQRPASDQQTFQSQSVVLTGSEFARIAAEARVVTREDEIRMHGDAKERKFQAQEASAVRKQKMQELEQGRRRNEKLSDLDQEAADRNNYLLSKAQQQIDEEEDEIKHLNELMLYAKCVAIRDAQVQEKGIIAKEREIEEKRLDSMMEIERIRALEEYEAREKQRLDELRNGASVIRQQIREREQTRLMEMELKDQETRAMLAHRERLREEDAEESRAKRSDQRRMMEEVAKANEEMSRLKDLEKEREKDEDLKILAYLHDKELREEEFQAEQERLRIEREREIARLYKIQEKSQDLQSERDALRAKRALEEYERNWRNKERSDAEKHAQNVRSLISTRDNQVQEKMKCQAIQARFDREEFNRVIGVQKSIEETEAAKRESQHTQRMQHAAEVRSQIREKEAERYGDRQEFFAEGTRNKEEQAEKLVKLAAIRERKLNELRSAGVPEKYCAEVERRVRATRTSFSNPMH